MTHIEMSPKRLELRSGSTTLTLDKDAGKASMKRKILFWERAPVEKELQDIADVTVDSTIDRSSGVEVCHTMLVSRAGGGWALPASNKKDAEAAARHVKEFLGLV